MSSDIGTPDLPPQNDTDDPQERAKAIAARDLAAVRISAALWPKFDRTNPAQQLSQQAEDILSADYQILQQLRTEEAGWQLDERYAWLLAFYCDDSIFEQIGSKLLDQTKPPVIYRTGFAASFDRFARASYGETALDKLDDAFAGEPAGVPSMAWRDWIVLSLKYQFQRPRPYQHAFDNSDISFKHKRSQKAYTPSIPSGHAFDATFAAIVVALGLPAWAPHRGTLPKWAANYGDLRNYAGVHYPSDNWASWIAVATIIEKMFSADIADIAKVMLAENIKSSRCFEFARQRSEFTAAKKALEELLGPLTWPCSGAICVRTLARRLQPTETPIRWQMPPMMFVRLQ